MKTIILTLVLIIPSLVKCQISSNIISKSEFDSIKINNISLSEISATDGVFSEVESLYSASITHNTQQSEEDYFDYTYDGFTIGFSENEICGFEISNSSWKITIQGKTVTIGDHKDKLGNVVINNQKNGGKSIVYQYCDGCNNFISIYLDTNNIITKIIYIEQT